MHRRPNLFIVGAMKSGTSSLHSYLGRHPSIFMCEPKEPCYFVDPAQLRWPAIEKLRLFRSESAYLELFASAASATVLGESSTLYSKLPRLTGVPERIARFNPSAKIVYLMRDPIERTISHYWHDVRWHREGRDMLTAIREEPHFRDVSNYALQISPYLRLFGESNVSTLTFEELCADPVAAVRRLCSWLGVDPGLIEQELGEAKNVTPRTVEQVRGRGRLDRFRYSRLWSLLGPAVPGWLRKIGRSLGARKVERDSQPIDRVAAFLRPQQQEQVAALTDLLGRPFPEWETLNEDRAS